MLRAMDAARFARELPGLFADFPRSEHPRDRRFAPLLERIGGLARENNLALINLAASLLEPGESYVEVGSFKGLSLADELVGLVGLDVHPDEEEGWEVSVGCVRTDRLVVRVFEAARSTGACGTLLLDGREYDV